MSTTQHTSHYNLPTFGDNPNDRPSWRGDFTDAMTTIDNQMYTNATNITTATAAANNATTAAQQAKESADSAAELAQTNKTDIAEQASYFNALGVTSVPTAQALMSTINGKAENTALTALQGTVSTLSDTVNGKADAANVYTKSQTDTTFTKQGGYSGTAQTLNQLISANTSDISSIESKLTEIVNWVNAWTSSWEELTVNFNHAQSQPIDNVYYNSTLKMIRMALVFGGNANEDQTATFTIPGYSASSEINCNAVGIVRVRDSGSGNAQRVAQVSHTNMTISTSGLCTINVPAQPAFGTFNVMVIVPQVLIVLSDYGTVIAPPETV